MIFEKFGRNILALPGQKCEYELISGIPDDHGRFVRMADNLWFLMHHSDDDNNRSLAICYVDDSGTHEASSFAVLGGMLLERQSFKDFESRWRAILKRHRIEPPLHMTDFVRPNGKYCTMYDELKLALFQDVVLAINQSKVYSLSFGVSQKDFKTILPMEVYRHFLSPYAMAFLLTAIWNRLVAEKTGYAGDFAYLVDRGSPYSNQIDEAHRAMIEWEKEGAPLHTGALAFEDDLKNSALQAADVVAWTARRILDDNGELPAEFAPLAWIFEECEDLETGAIMPHYGLTADGEFLRIFGESINEWLNSRDKSMPRRIADAISNAKVTTRRPVNVTVKLKQ